jgi:hypothetical protein
MVGYLCILAATVLSLAAFLWKWIPMRNVRRVARFAEARRDFHRQRERLEAKFVQLGMVSGRSDVPRWSDCDFDDDVAYARNRSTGELSAFVAVTIEMEDSDRCVSSSSGAVSNLRVATAVFRFDHDHWETDGRAIFNLNPTEAIRFYHRDLELLGQEVIQPR